MNQTHQALSSASPSETRTAFGIPGAIGVSHLLIDMIQSLLLALYPLLQAEFTLSFMQTGLITLIFQLASSLLQPVTGYVADKYPMPWPLPLGTCLPCTGLLYWYWRDAFLWYCWRRHWQAQIPPSFIRNSRALLVWPPASVMGWLSRCFR